MRSSARSRDDADVIRARLRALLAEAETFRGWVPDDEDEVELGPSTGAAEDAAGDDAGEDQDRWADDPDLSGPARGSAAAPTGLGRHRAPGRTARLDPGRPGAWALWAVAVLAATAVVGWTWFSRPTVDQMPAAVSYTAPTAPSTSAGTGDPAAQAGAAPPAAPAPGVAATVVVSVIGQVARPGLVTLPAGSRVADALAAAGGLLPEADAASINAAAVLSDGQQVAVGVPGAPQPAAGGTAAGATGGALLDLNTATVADLDALPGIGPVLAQRIVDHRASEGPFTSVDQLDDVSGIGPAVFADLVDRVRV